MNREIKFRGYDEENKCWRYGYYTKLVEGVRKIDAIITDSQEDGLTRYYIHNNRTIGQYTGLTDKNGVDIYEGDIIQVSNDFYGVFYGPVSFKKGCFGVDNFQCVQVENPERWGLDENHNCVDSYGFITPDFSKFYGGYSNIKERDLIEIIGNIHENKELLE